MQSEQLCTEIQILQKEQVFFEILTIQTEVTASEETGESCTRLKYLNILTSFY